MGTYNGSLNFTEIIWTSWYIERQCLIDENEKLSNTKQNRLMAYILLYNTFSTIQYRGTVCTIQKNVSSHAPSIHALEWGWTHYLPPDQPPGTNWPAGGSRCLVMGFITPIVHFSCGMVSMGCYCGGFWFTIPSCGGMIWCVTVSYFDYNNTSVVEGTKN